MTVLILVAEYALDLSVARKGKTFVLAFGSPSCTSAVVSAIEGDPAVVVALVLGLLAGKVFMAFSSLKVPLVLAIALRNKPG